MCEWAKVEDEQPADGDIVSIAIGGVAQYVAVRAYPSVNEIHWLHDEDEEPASFSLVSHWRPWSDPKAQF